MLALSHQRECVSTKITSITGERLSRNRRIGWCISGLLNSTWCSSWKDEGTGIWWCCKHVWCSKRSTGQNKPDIPGAIYTHCKAHCLNLIITHACKIPLIRNMKDIVQTVAFTFQYSAKRINMFKEELKENITAKGSMEKIRKLQTTSMCETRWASRANALFTFRAFLDVIDDCNVVLLFCGLKEKDKLQNEILNKKKTLIYKKKKPNIYCNE